MERRDALIQKGAKTVVQQNAVISGHYHGMMDNAVLRGITVLRMRAMLLLNELEPSRKVKKHRKRILEFLDKVRAIDNKDMTQKNRMKEFQKPLKQIREDFDGFVRNSLSNVLDKKQIQRILIKAQKMGELLADEATETGEVITDEKLKKAA